VFRPGVEELLAERGIAVDHVAVYRRVHRFTPLLADAVRSRRHAPDERWFVDWTPPSTTRLAAAFAELARVI